MGAGLGIGEWCAGIPQYSLFKNRSENRLFTGNSP